MEIQYLTLKSLRIKESRYHFLQITDWNSGGEKIRVLTDSIRELGIIQPLIVHRLGDDFHLIDGFKRVLATGKLGIKTVPCYIIPAGTTLKAILELLLLGHHHRLSSSPVSKVLFIRLTMRLGIDRNILLHHFFPLLELKGHKALLKKIETIAKLPLVVLDFCDEKDFSIKQCLHLTRYPEELLLHVFSWREKLSLTASTVEELLTNIKDYLNGTGKKVSEFLEKEEVKILFASPLPPQERTKQLRQIIKKLRFPVLTETNANLDKIRKGLSLPNNVNLSWDRTLEQRELNLLFNIKEPEEWEKTLKDLKAEKVSRGIEAILKKL